MVLHGLGASRAAGEGRAAMPGASPAGFDAPIGRPEAALRVAPWRAPGSLRRSPDGPASRVASRLPGARATAS